MKQQPVKRQKKDQLYVKLRKLGYQNFQNKRLSVPLDGTSPGKVRIVKSELNNIYKTPADHLIDQLKFQGRHTSN